MSRETIVREIYAAFGRGDVPAILDRLADDVVWQPGSGEGYGVPWLEPQKGHRGTARFFEALGQLDITHFEPLTFLSGDHQVAVPFEWEATVRATGRPIRDIEVHLWTFDDTDLITEFHCFLDTHMNVTANQP